MPSQWPFAIARFISSIQICAVGVSVQLGWVVAQTTSPNIRCTSAATKLVTEPTP